jgi:hypothetical protein
LKCFGFTWNLNKAKKKDKNLKINEKYKPIIETGSHTEPVANNL